MVILTLLVGGCGASGGQPTPTPDPATLGQQTFAQWCAPCHGADGEGFINALNAPSLRAGGQSHLLTDAEIMRAIIDGGAESGGAMTPLGDQLTAEQEAAVLEYVHSLWSDAERADHEH
jgi:mono/diheme cytochrome c family protein